MLSVNKFALIYVPPTVVIEYERSSQSYLKKIRVKNPSKYTPASLLDKLVRAYKEFLGPEVVSHSQLADIVTLLLSRSGGSAIEDKIRSSSSSTSKENNDPHAKGKKGDNAETDSTFTPLPAHLAIASKYGDLNKVSDEVNARAKKEMSQDFERNRLRPGDPGFQYDIQVSWYAISFLCIMYIHPFSFVTCVSISYPRWTSELSRRWCLTGTRMRMIEKYPC